MTSNSNFDDSFDAICAAQRRGRYYDPFPEDEPDFPDYNFKSQAESVKKIDGPSDEKIEQLKREAIAKDGVAPFSMERHFEVVTKLRQLSSGKFPHSFGTNPWSEARKAIYDDSEEPDVPGIGGFGAGRGCLAAYRSSFNVVAPHASHDFSVPNETIGEARYEKFENNVSNVFVPRHKNKKRVVMEARAAMNAMKPSTSAIDWQLKSTETEVYVPPPFGSGLLKYKLALLKTSDGIDEYVPPAVGTNCMCRSLVSSSNYCSPLNTQNEPPLLPRSDTVRNDGGQATDGNKPIDERNRSSDYTFDSCVGRVMGHNVCVRHGRKMMGRELRRRTPHYMSNLVDRDDYRK